MKTQSTLLFIVLSLIISPAVILAQGRETTPSSDPPMERIRIQPEGHVPSKPAQPERASDPAVPSEEKSLPVSHLWGDVDSDGLKDLFVLDLRGNLLFHNLGDGDFMDVTALAFPDGAGRGISGFFGDYNGDAVDDLFLFHDEGFALYRNEGDLRFTNVTEELGLDPGLSGGCARLEDYDGDGFNDLLVKSPKGDRIFHSRKGKRYAEVSLTCPSRGGGLATIRWKPANAVPAMKVPGGPFSPALGSTGESTVNALFVNDNSPGSVGEGIPEVEGGDDGTTLNDIVDGTVTGADIKDESLTGADLENDSVDPEKVTGTAATLTGNQNFDSGTLYIDATNNRVGIGTTNPSIASLHIESDEFYGCRAETSIGGWAIYGRASISGGSATGVYGEAESTSGRGLYGRAKATTGTTYGVRGESESTSGKGVFGLASAATGENNGVEGVSSSTSGRGVYGRSPYKGVEGYSNSTSGSSFGVHGESDSTSGRGVSGKATATTGITYGVRGESDSTSGRGIYGRASATSGMNHGIKGESNSTSGRGVSGMANASSGTTYGVYGESSSSSGYGVYGHASASSGITCGVHGECDSPLGYGVVGTSPFLGVYGQSSATSGTTYGLYGECDSKSGRGVYGRAKSDSGYTYGVKGVADSPDGYGVSGTAPFMGVYGTTSGSSGVKHGVSGVSASTSGRGVSGTANASSGTTYGVRGENASTSGRGVYGNASAKTGTTYGVKGDNASTEGTGVCGLASADTGFTIGVYGVSDSTNGRGVYGRAFATSGFNYGVRGWTSSSSGYGMYSTGDFGCSGKKFFVQPHPRDPSKEIRFVCLEGNESGTYFRGSSKLLGGEAVIEVPEEFRLVTEEQGLTVQVTPLGAARIWVEEKTLDQIVVQGDMDVEFDYFVNGVRKGFAEFEPILENHEWVPEYRDRPFGTQFPEALRRILVENGTLNPDFTPNQKTAARMGWELREFEEKNPRLVDAKEPESPKPRQRIPKQDPIKREERDLELSIKAPKKLDLKERFDDPDQPKEKPVKPSHRDESPTTHETTVKER